MALIVQKFGGSSVADAERVRRVAGIIADTYVDNNDVVVVLSAQGDTTDELIEKYNIQYWAIPKNGDLYKYLTQNSKAKVLTEDSNFAFLRTEGGENG